MVSPASFAAALTSYRLRAASQHATFLKTKYLTPAPNSALAQSPSPEHYQRHLFPELECYLQQAARAYKLAKDAPPPPQSRRRRQFAALLGTGEIVEALAADVRRAKWVVASILEKHRRNAVRQGFIDVVVACGIPWDVRQSARQKYLKRDQRLWGALTIVEKIGHAEGSMESNEADWNELRGDVSGFGQHVARCQEGLRAGLTTLYARGMRKHTRLDSFEDVKRRYVGKPDEVYRRKTARKFATFRKQRQQMEGVSLQALGLAEVEMKRRRGHDHLLTSRATGDSSFAPFLFELDSNAYAFSSKITEAPKLRKVMINKYSARTDFERGPNALEKAKQVAETNPLFHTRVMNRFM